MMQIEQKIQTRIDAYLMNLRRCLRELPAEDVNEILREIRSHILDRAEAAGELTDERIVEILRALGRPEDIGPLYEADALVARARASFSPTLILRTTMRWAMRSAAGFVIFIGGLIGYSTSLVLLVCALLKPFMPSDVGMWIYDGGLSIGTISNAVRARELMGWWLIPFCIVASAVLLIATTRFLRVMLRYARATPLHAG